MEEVPSKWKFQLQRARTYLNQGDTRSQNETPVLHSQQSQYSMGETETPVGSHQNRLQWIVFHKFMGHLIAG